MSDVAEVKEAIEYVEETLQIGSRASSVATVSPQMAAVVAAARRWVRLVEGLDYEAASVLGDKLMAENPRLPDIIPLYIVRQIVDAAVGVEKP